jgi:AbrB family looped-hinge helix DNA binding protein
MVKLEVKLSSKGQIVIPKEVREKLGLKAGDKIKLEVEEGRRVIIQPSVKPPKDVFVKAGDRLIEEALQEAKRVDEEKIREMLKSLGVKD